MTQEKDQQVERLRRLCAVLHEPKSSRLKTIFARLSSGEVKKASQSKQAADSAAAFPEK